MGAVNWAAMTSSVAARFATLDRLTLKSADISPEIADESLVKAAQNGDRAAFGHLYQRYVRMVHGILLARVPAIAAEDLVHDVFLQALPRLASLRDASCFGPWLATIARNRATDFHRRTKPESSFDHNTGTVEKVQEPQAGIGLEDGMALLRALRDLPDAYREPLILRFVEGMSGPEIAARTGLTHGSVRVNLHRGMQMLRQRWEER